MAAPSYWLERLRERHGDNVIDVLATATEGLKEQAQHLNFGLHIVPNAVPPDLLQRLEEAFEPTMQDMCRGFWVPQRQLLEELATVTTRGRQQNWVVSASTATTPQETTHSFTTMALVSQNP